MTRRPQPRPRQQRVDVGVEDLHAGEQVDASGGALPHRHQLRAVGAQQHMPAVRHWRPLQHGDGASVGRPHRMDHVGSVHVQQVEAVGRRQGVSSCGEGR